eukprot:gene44218-54065_t
MGGNHSRPPDRQILISSDSKAELSPQLEEVKKFLESCCVQTNITWLQQCLHHLNDEKSDLNRQGWNRELLCGCIYRAFLECDLRVTRPEPPLALSDISAAHRRLAFKSHAVVLQVDEVVDISVSQMQLRDREKEKASLERRGGRPRDAWVSGGGAGVRKLLLTDGQGSVPALLLDYTADQRHIGYRGADQEMQGQRIYNGLFHVSDWMPTLLALAGVPKERWPGRMDGHDFSAIFPQVPYITATQPSLYLNVTYGYTRSSPARMLRVYP